MLLHELGHVLGLAHPCEQESAGDVRACSNDFDNVLMNPAYSAERLELSDDDRAGVCSLYVDQADTGAGGAGGAGGATSSETVGVPRRGLHDGYPCNLDTECESGACDGQCLKACDDKSDCSSGDRCEMVESGANACLTSRALFGDPCSAADDCASGICLTRENAAVCSAECANDQCPPNWECSSVEDKSTCVPTEPHAESSCAMHPARAQASATLALLAGALLSFARRRRVRPDQRSGN